MLRRRWKRKGRKWKRINMLARLGEMFEGGDSGREYNCSQPHSEYILWEVD